MILQRFELWHTTKEGSIKIGDFYQLLGSPPLPEHMGKYRVVEMGLTHVVDNPVIKKVG